MKMIYESVMFLDIVGALKTLEDTAMKIGKGVIAIGIIYCIVQAAIKFFGGDSQGGWKFVFGCIIGVVLFASMSFFSTELPNMLK
jgi:hypothetical protein